MTDAAFLIDSNIAIYVLADAGSAAARRIAARRRGAVVTSTIVYAEVMRGIPGRERQAVQNAMRFFRLIEPAPFDMAAAEAYANLPFKRARFDRIIAAHALALGLTLVTNNPRDFEDISGLKVENWAA